MKTKWKWRKGDVPGWWEARDAGVSVEVRKTFGCQYIWEARSDSQTNIGTQFIWGRSLTLHRARAAAAAAALLLGMEP